MNHRLMKIYLVTSQDTEAVDDLFGSVGVCRLASHEVEESVELYVAGVVGVHDGKNTLEVDVALPVLADRVAEWHQAGLEFFWGESARSVLVEVVEAASELAQLFLRYSLEKKFH